MSESTQNDSLVTAGSSAGVIRKAFDRVSRLLDSLAGEVGNKLPKNMTPVNVTSDVRFAVL